MENRWDIIENCAYASLSNNASLTKEEHKKMISKNQAMVFPLVLNGDAFVCVEMTNKDNGRKYILACGNEDSWLNVRYEFKIRKRWTTSRLSVGAAINTVRRGDFAGVCFIFNQDMIWLDIDELKSMDKSNELSKFIIALVQGIPLDATNEDGKTCLVVAEDEVTMERFARQILSNNPQSLNHIEYIPSTRQQIYNMVCGDSNWDGVVIADSSGSVTMICRDSLEEWAKLQNTWIARRKGLMSWNIQILDEINNDSEPKCTSNDLAKNFNILRKTFLTKLEVMPDSNIMEMQEYIDLLKGLAEFDVLYCLTHPTHYDSNTKTNIPVIADLPNIGKSLCIFTDFESMADFEEKFNRKNMYIKLNKEDCKGTGPYDSVFQIARLGGAHTLMIHSSSGVIPIKLSHFIEVANLYNGPRVRMTAQDLEDMLRGGKKRIDFNRAPVWSLNELKIESNKEN